MRSMRLLFICALASAALLLPTLPVGAARPFRTFTAVGTTPTAGEGGCCLWWSSRFIIQAEHDQVASLQQWTSDDRDVAPSVCWFTGACDGRPGDPPCQGVIHIAMGATTVEGPMGAARLDSPDYWEGYWTSNKWMAAHGRVTFVAQGFGRLRGLEMSGDIVSGDPYRVAGTITGIKSQRTPAAPPHPEGLRPWCAHRPRSLRPIVPILSWAGRRNVVAGCSADALTCAPPAS